VFDHVEVNGADALPLYSFLKQQQPLSTPGSQQTRPNGDISWNYE
jgi:glutathione peroxidase-family protein